MDKILIPCDFSEQAINAFRMAIDLAHTNGAEVHLLHVIELPVMHDDVLTPMPTFDETLLKELTTGAEEKFAALKKDFGKEHLFLKTKIEFGPIVPLIIDYGKDNGISLIVMGTKGVSGLKEVLIGSNAEKVVRNAECPVIAVKKYSTLVELKHIVFPNSMEEGQEDLVMRVKAIQHVLKATLDLVWIDTSNKADDHAAIKKQLEEFANRFMLKDYTVHVYKASNKETGIINFTHWINANMIVMGTHARKGLSHLLKGSVAEGVVNHVDVPIWTYVIKR